VEAAALMRVAVTNTETTKGERMMKTINRRSIGAAMLLAVTAGIATPAFAGAFYLQDQSAKATGRAYSGEVAYTGAESLWWNPASIAGMEGESERQDGGQQRKHFHRISPSGCVKDARIIPATCLKNKQN